MLIFFHETDYHNIHRYKKDIRVRISNRYYVILFALYPQEIIQTFHI